MDSVADRVANRVNSMVQQTLKRQESGEMSVFEHKILDLIRNDQTEAHSLTRDLEYLDELETCWLFCFVTRFYEIKAKLSYYNFDYALNCLYRQLTRCTRLQLLYMSIDKNDGDLVKYILGYMDTQTLVEKVYPLHYIVEKQPSMLNDVLRYVKKHRIDLFRALITQVDPHVGMDIFNYTCAVCDDKSLVPSLQILENLCGNLCVTRRTYTRPTTKVTNIDRWGRNTWLILMRNMCISSLTILKAFLCIEQEEKLTAEDYLDLNLAVICDNNNHTLTYYLCKRHDTHVGLFNFLAQRKMLKVSPRKKLGESGFCVYSQWEKFDEIELLIMFQPLGTKATSLLLKEKIRALLTGDHEKGTLVITENYMRLPAEILAYLIEEEGFGILTTPESHHITQGLSVFSYCLIHRYYRKAQQDPPPSIEVTKKRQLLTKHRGQRSLPEKSQVYWYYWCNFGLKQCHIETLRWAAAFEGVFRVELDTENTPITEDERLLCQWIIQIRQPDASNLAMICMHQIYQSLEHNPINGIWCISQLPLPWRVKEWLCFDLDLTFMK